MNTSNLRMLFFVRTDLNMPKGKIAAQVGHAVQYLLYKELTGIPSDLFLPWLNEDATKICLKVSSEEELLRLFWTIEYSGFPHTLVKDKGYTQFNGVETNTVVGWGPLRKEDHEKLTAHLKLL